MAGSCAVTMRAKPQAGLQALGVFQGSATLQFGGDNTSSTVQEVSAGDCLIIPAGVAALLCRPAAAGAAPDVHACTGVGHKQLEGRQGFTMVGAYPEGGHHHEIAGKHHLSSGRLL